MILLIFCFDVLRIRFTEMMRNKTSASTRSMARDEMTNQARASAKNRRLAEQMSRRTGGQAVMDKIERESKIDIRDRLSKSQDIKSRLGTPNRGNVRNRLGSTRGNIRGRGNIPRGQRGVFGNNRGRVSQRGSGRGSFRGSRSIRNQSGRGRGRGRGRGFRRGNRGGRGGRGGGRFSRSDLDHELESYMAN